MGRARLLELGARRAEALFWGADPEFFAPQPVEKEIDVFFYGYGDKFRRDWMKTMVGEPSRSAPELDVALGGLDFQGDTGTPRLLGDIPFNVFARAISPARVNLNITRRPHATVQRSSTARPFELASSGAAIVSNPHAGIERWFEPGRELLVVETPRRPSRPTASSSPIPARRRRWGARAASASSTSTRTRTARGGCSSSSVSRPGCRCDAARDRRGRPRLQRVRARSAGSSTRSVPPGPDRRRRRRRRVDRRHRRRRRGARARPSSGCPSTSGIGGAVQTGFRYALDEGYDRAVRLDGDGQHDAAEIAKLFAPLERGEADLVIGSRFVDGGGSYRPPFARRLGIRVFARLVSLLGGQRVTDTTSGFIALDRAGIELFAREYPHDYPEVEATLVALRSGLRLSQVQVEMRERETGSSSITFVRSLYYIVKVLLALLVASLRRYPRLEGAAGDPVRVSIVGVLASVLLILVVLELVRGRRLKERYALLWLATGVVLLVLSAWRGGLNTIAGWLGVTSYPPAVLFAVATLFILLVLLHYSTVISKLTDENVELAQRIALLEERVSRLAADETRARWPRPHASIIRQELNRARGVAAREVEVERRRAAADAPAGSRGRAGR